MRLEIRPLLLFVSAYAINSSVHEAAHAVAAYTLGIPARLFHIYASVDLSSASIHDQTVVRSAGPIASLAFGALCWLGYRAARTKWAELPLFYFAVFGIAMFLGNVLSTATVGDFSNAAVAAGLNLSTRRVIASVGWALLAAFAALVGQRLRAFATLGDMSPRSTFDFVVIPAMLGTVAIIVLYQPMTLNDALARASEEAVFWMFAALAARLHSAKAPRSDHPLDVRVGDWVLAAAAVALVGILALGIPFVP